MSNDKTAALNIRLPVDIKEALDDRAETERRTITAITEFALRQYLYGADRAPAKGAK